MSLLKRSFGLEQSTELQITLASSYIALGRSNERTNERSNERSNLERQSQLARKRERSL